MILKNESKIIYNVIKKKMCILNKYSNVLFIKEKNTFYTSLNSTTIFNIHKSAY